MPVPSLPEIARVLYATWRLARGDSGSAIAMLPDSPADVWKSFFVAILLAPFWAMLVWSTGLLVWQDFDTLAVVLINLASYATAWFLWPVISLELARLAGQTHHWRRYVVACNWSEIWVMLLRLPVVAAIVGGSLPPSAAALLWLVSLGVVLAYRFVIARDVLGLSPVAALGAAVLELLLSFGWSAFEDAMLAPWVVKAVPLSG